jgi:hypothetical protein
MSLDYLSDEQRARFERLKPLRVIVELNTVNAPEVRALCEESFSMNYYTDRAMIFWSSNTATSNLGGSFKVDGVSWASQNHQKYDPTQIVFDPLSDDCPIDIDWRRWLEDLDADSKASKFDKRNARFTVKPHGLWQMRALVAESQFKTSSETLNAVRIERDTLLWQVERITEIINSPSTDETESE